MFLARLGILMGIVLFLIALCFIHRWIRQRLCPHTEQTISERDGTITCDHCGRTKRLHPLDYI